MVFAQLFDASQNPLSVKWRQIQASGFQIIYPKELENEAQRMANTFTKIYPLIGEDLALRQTRIPVVLQNRGTTANGFVQLAPKKTQFYTTPPQHFDSQDWLNNLAVHELRHVAQFDKFTGPKERPFPEEFFFAYIGISTPTWFLEGDAVAIETSLTDAGRGRQPSWIMPFRTTLLEGKKFSYSKSYFGSSKDITPGYYQLGYLLSARLKMEYGENVIKDLLDDVTKRPLRPYPFSQSLKKITGKNTRRWYDYNLLQLEAEWKAQHEQNQREIYTPLNRTATFATDYLLPQAVNESEVLCLRQSKASPPSLTLLNIETGREKELFTIGYQEQPWFSYGNSLVVWTELRYDPRYKQRSYSVVCSYDLERREKKQLTFKSRIFSPSLSADGKQLVAITIDLSNQAKLVAIDLENGNLREIHTEPRPATLQTPALNADGTALTWIRVTEEGKSLWLKQGSEPARKIIDETRQQLGRPVFNSDRIIFNAHLSGIDNIFEINPATGKIMALSASKYGAFNASISHNGKEILFNDFQLTGYQVVKAPLKRTEVQTDQFVYFGAKADTIPAVNIFKGIPTETFESKPYRPFSHLFRFHSVSPVVNDAENAGLYLKSTDLLGLADTYAGINYNSGLQKMEYEAGITIKALYPIFSASYRNRPRTAFYKTKTTIHQANWRENYLNLKASLPLSVTRFSHSYVFLTEISSSFTQRNLNNFDAKTIHSSIRFPMSYLFGFTHVVRTAERDISPRFAQSFNLLYYHQPFDKRFDGSLFAFQSGLYFPGVATNHTFSTHFNYQHATGALRANTEIQTVYGYAQIKARSALHNSLLFNYRFPIAFPDWEAGPLAYIRNIRAGLFTHYENIGKENNFSQPKTFGIELRSSMNLLRYQPLADIGARMIFVNRSYRQNPIFEFIFNYSF